MLYFRNQLSKIISNKIKNDITTLRAVHVIAKIIFAIGKLISININLHKKQSEL